MTYYKKQIKESTQLIVIRCYALAENAVNAQMLIQDLLVAELESLINTNKPKVIKNFLIRVKVVRVLDFL